MRFDWLGDELSFIYDRFEPQLPNGHSPTPNGFTGRDLGIDSGIHPISHPLVMSPDENFDFIWKIS